MFDMSQKGNQLHDGINLQLEHSFGCYQTPIQKNSFFTNEDVIIYLCGNHIVQYDIVTKRQSFVMKDIEDQQVSCLNTFYSTKNDELYIAVGLKSTASVLPQVKVYRNKKSIPHCLVHSHLKNQSQIIDLTFLMKKEFMLTLTKTQESQYSLNVFKVRNDKLMSYDNIENGEGIFRIEMGDKTENQFMTVGPTSLKVWSYDNKDSLLDTNVDLYEQIEEPIVDAVMLEEYPFIIVATQSNKLIMFKDLKKACTEDIQLVSTDTYGSPFAKRQNISQQDQEDLQKVLANTYVSCLCKTQSGVVLGFKGQGMVGVYEIEKHNKLTHKGNFYIQSNDNISFIHCINVSSDDMFAILTVVFEPKGQSAHQKYGTIQEETAPASNINTSDPSQNQGKLEHIIFDLGYIHALQGMSKYPFEQIFYQGVHKGIINNIQVVPWRTMLVSLCQDKYVKFWEYPASKSGGTSEYKSLISQYFHEPPLAIDIHPTSVQCAIGFKDSLKFYYICQDSLKNILTFSQKQCSALAYCYGGHLLAASNYNTINIYNPYSYEVVLSLSGHSSQINRLEWVDLDYYNRVERLTQASIQQVLYSTSVSGQLYCWNIYRPDPESDPEIPYTKILEHPAPSKGFKYNTLTYDYTFDRIVAACDDMKVRIYPKLNTTTSNKKNDFGSDNYMNEPEMDRYFEYDTSPLQFTAICISENYQAIFFGTDSGSVRIFFWPFFQKSQKQIEFVEIPIHQATVTALKLTPDDKYLISCSSDNAIFVSKLKFYQDGEEQDFDILYRMEMDNQDDQIYHFLLQELALGSYIHQEQQLEQIKELQYRVQNFTTDIEDEKERRQDIFGQKLETLQEKHRDSKNKQRETLASIFNDHENKYNSIKDKLSKVKYQYKQKTDQMNQENAKKLLENYKINDQLNTELELLKAKYAEQLNSSKKAYTVTIKKIEEEYQDKYRELQERHTESLIRSNQDTKKFTEVSKQSEEDFNLYRKRKEDELKRKIKEQEEITDHLRSDNSQKIKQIQSLRDRKVFLQGLIQDTKNENDNLLEELRNFEIKKSAMQKQLSEKEEIINAREQQIKDYRSKNTHLQNFQKVYDYRMTTLQEERQPLIEHLTNMDKHVKHLYKELLDEAGQNKQFDIDRSQGSDQTTDLKAQLKSKEYLVQDTRTMIEVFKNKVTSILKNAQFKQWPKMLKDLYNESFTEQQEKLDKILESSIIGSNLKQKDPLLLQMEKKTQQEIGNNLKGQKDFLSKKLNTVTQDYHLEMEDRNNAYLRVQNMNTLLINECNKLREQKSKLKEYLGIQNKALREVDRELESYKREAKINGYLDDTQEIQTQEESQEAIQLSDRKSEFKKKPNQKVKPLPFQNYEQRKFFSATVAQFNKSQTNLQAHKFQNFNDDKQQNIRDLLKQIETNNDYGYDQQRYSSQKKFQGKQNIRNKVNDFMIKEDGRNSFQKDKIQTPQLKPNQIIYSQLQLGKTSVDNYTQGSAAKQQQEIYKQMPNSRSTKMSTQTNFQINNAKLNSRGNNQSSRGAMGSTLGSVGFGTRNFTGSQTGMNFRKHKY